MGIEKLPEWLRASGAAFLYWAVFLLALEPGNVLHARSVGAFLHFDREALRISVAALLACSTAPLILALNRRYPISGGGGLRAIAIHAGSAMGLSLVMILISCVLAAWFFMGKAAPSLSELRGQLAANWLLLTFALCAFSVLSRALQRQSERRCASIPVKTRGRLGYVDLASIEWIEAQGNYLSLHVGGQSHLVRETLRSFATRLDQERFVRVHRRAIVAVDRIREIQPLANGDAQLILHDGQAIRASRSYRQLVRARWAQVKSRPSATPC